MGAGISSRSKISFQESRKVVISVDDLCSDVVGWVIDRRHKEENKPLRIIYVHSPMENSQVVSRFVSSLKGCKDLEDISVKTDMPGNYQERQGYMIVDVDSLVTTYDVTGL